MIMETVVAPSLCLSDLLNKKWKKIKKRKIAKLRVVLGPGGKRYKENSTSKLL
jgi:hypothetical protein